MPSLAQSLMEWPPLVRVYESRFWEAKPSFRCVLGHLFRGIYARPFAQRLSPSLSGPWTCPEGDPPCSRCRGFPHSGRLSSRREPPREASRRYPPSAIRAGFLQREWPQLDAHDGRLLWPEAATCCGAVAHRRRDQALIVCVRMGCLTRRCSRPPRNGSSFRRAPVGGG